jgi:hypothetical protein
MNAKMKTKMSVPHVAMPNRCRDLRKGVTHRGLVVRSAQLAASVMGRDSVGTRARIRVPPFGLEPMPNRTVQKLNAFPHANQPALVPVVLSLVKTASLM